MKNFKIAGLLAAMVAAAAVSTTAGAANYIEISGAHTDFYYDADLYGVGSATVVGDSISFAMPSSYSASVTLTADSSASTYYSEGYKYFANGLIAVAHTGYELNASLTTNAKVELTNAGGSNRAVLDLTGRAYGGSYDNGIVTKDATAALQYAFGADAGITYTHPGTIVLPSSPNVFAADGLYSTLVLENRLDYTAIQSGIGTSTVRIDSLSYAFTLVPDGTTVPPVSTVPEPETYAMLLAGLGLLGLMQRRRQSST